MLDFQDIDAFAAAFTVLGRLHVQPADQQTRAQVCSMLDEWPLSPSVSEHTATGLELLRESALAEESDSDVVTDYDTLYGISAGAKVPPFESVHRGEDRLVFDKQTLEVRSAYAELGLQAPRYNAEPDDHVGLELDFLGRCLDARLNGNAQAFDAAVTFTRDHVEQWAPAMLEAAFEQATTSWLKGVIALSRGAVDSWIGALNADA
ncbi:TorD/DmsD family molecular chaperone [Arcanobacterium haemolyticum]|uniref:Cytoplasmic chaperone TorD family protein n=1 Tax=Arcanobacterium haemolyticum (strain ATCC 9345 / DSM 20595 / CCM 5947 / CCUG 17215 / LMG 16163 / NBRC 15585 / NCTC 8452 / 11018) TaxID=644284 RepID=D7BJX8_ARCHD|nr:molecular chaperone TorD family protein [Arcanobacterium haemolyticum]ADH92958.1 cytoplasmic chaperone TorD family protein [Arcanobacterium haemolyticum DSM 20595]SQH28286.1 twin-argninine leader-binding protein DmsD [Arcanobacterium haemolyticum]